MEQLKHLGSAIGWCLMGMLLTSLLINIIGLISPFWGHWMHPKDLSASRDLLKLWQVITPWFSVCFAVAAWHLAMAYQSLVARIGVIAMGALIPVAHVGSSFAARAMEQETSGASYRFLATINMLANAYFGLAALVFIALVWWVVRQLSESLQCAPEQHG